MAIIWRNTDRQGDRRGRGAAGGIAAPVVRGAEYLKAQCTAVVPLY